MNFLRQVWEIATRYRVQLFSGVGVTMLIALTGTLAGLLIGRPGSSARRRSPGKSRSASCTGP